VVWNRDKVAGVPDPQRLFFGRRRRARNVVRRGAVDGVVAVPLRDTVLQKVKGDVRFLINLSIQLAPWRL
jgi:hypothetical protein